jgi:hypothetical protein
MSLHTTFVGTVVSEPKQFGNLIVIRAAHNPSKSSNFKSVYVDLKLKADGYQGANALKFKVRDDITAIGRLEDEEWKNKKGSSLVMLFPQLEIPYAIRSRGTGEVAPTELTTEEVDEDPFRDIPA